MHKDRSKVMLLQDHNAFCCHGSHWLGRVSEATLLYKLWLIFNINLGSSSSHLEILMFLAFYFTYIPFLTETFATGILGISLHLSFEGIFRARSHLKLRLVRFLFRNLQKPLSLSIGNSNSYFRAISASAWNLSLD